MQFRIHFLISLAVRLSAVFMVSTYFVPDEYWQSLEVAHNLAFGRGYLTWEWKMGIRSYIYPVFIAIIYKLLALLRMDTIFALTMIPRILQAVLAAYADYRLFMWSGQKKWSLFLNLASWFLYYTCSRTLANTLEASLTTIALSFFPWYVEHTGYIWIAALSCFIRPTAAAIWAPLVIYHLNKTVYWPKKLILSRYVSIGLIVSVLCIAIDSYMYGKFIITPYEFIKFNLFHNVGTHYGTSPWYWYFINGLPTALSVTFLLFIPSVMQTIQNTEVYPVRKQLLISIACSLIVLSCIDHKEIRFILPLVPMCLYICGDTISRWSRKASNLAIWIIALGILIGNAIPAWYLSTLHQTAPLSVMSELQQIARNYSDTDGNRASILFLMPCHSTPYYSHIHENITMRFLTCEPNLENKNSYTDEAEQFFAAPERWLRAHVPVYPRRALPTHVVMYETLPDYINEFLQNYRKIIKVMNGDLDKVIMTQVFLPQLPNLLKTNVDISALLLKIRGQNILVYERLIDKDDNLFNIEVQKTLISGEDDILDINTNIDSTGVINDDGNQNAFN